MDKKLTVICLYGGPGSGKSTSAAGLFYKMKLKGYKCELVTEAAKDYTYDGRHKTLDNQFYVMAKQEARLRRLIGQVDFAITDSPLPLGMIYVKPPYDGPWFTEACASLYKNYDNINYFIKRVKPYAAYGRSQTEDEARALDGRIRDVIDLLNISLRMEVPGDFAAPDTILDDLETFIGV